jgi:hypothetical protein
VITTLRDVMAKVPKRPAPTEHESKCLRVQVRVETYAWLSSIAGEHGIGGALDLMAEIHRGIEKAASPLGVENNS